MRLRDNGNNEEQLRSMHELSLTQVEDISGVALLFMKLLLNTIHVAALSLKIADDPTHMFITPFTLVDVADLDVMGLAPSEYVNRIFDHVNVTENIVFDYDCFCKMIFTWCDTCLILPQHISVYGSLHESMRGSTVLNVYRTTSFTVDGSLLLDRAEMLSTFLCILELMLRISVDIAFMSQNTLEGTLQSMRGCQKYASVPGVLYLAPFLSILPVKYYSYRFLVR